MVTPQRVAEIDLGAIRHNVRFLRGRVPADVRFIAVVKADGY
ncbi:MAG: alanine racemase, partial [Candidatus Dormibacteraeota bacterium]|nr:alanine racemase [Candidatus Dormibacteraeota bacterium]